MRPQDAPSRHPMKFAHCERTPGVWDISIVEFAENPSQQFHRPGEKSPRGHQRAGLFRHEVHTSPAHPERNSALATHVSGSSLGGRSTRGNLALRRTINARLHSPWHRKDRRTGQEERPPDPLSSRYGRHACAGRSRRATGRVRRDGTLCGSHPRGPVLVRLRDRPGMSRVSQTSTGDPRPRAARRDASLIHGGPSGVTVPGIEPRKLAEVLSPT